MVPVDRCSSGVWCVYQLRLEARLSFSPSVCLSGVQNNGEANVSQGQSLLFFGKNLAPPRKFEWSKQFFFEKTNLGNQNRQGRPLVVHRFSKSFFGLENGAVKSDKS